MRIENSITRVTVQHREVCRVMPNSYPERRNFQFAPNNHCRFFFLAYSYSTIVSKLENVLFYQFYAEINAFSIKKCSVWHLCTTYWLHARGRLTPLHARRKYPEWVKIAENLFRYPRKNGYFDTDDFLQFSIKHVVSTYWNCLCSA